MHGNGQEAWACLLLKLRENIQHFKCQETTHTSNYMLLYRVVIRIVYYPALEDFFPRFLKRLSNSYHWAVTMFLFNHPSVFCGRISFPLLLLHCIVHQNNLLCFVEPPLCTTSLQLPRGSIINAKVHPPKSPRPLSVRNEIKWWIDRKSPPSVLFSFHF